MKITTEFKLNLKTKEVEDKVKKASRQGLVDSITDIANDVIYLSPHITGHNRRSIAYKLEDKVTQTGQPQGDEKPFIEWAPDIKSLEGAIYSTSGYGGFLETGHHTRSGSWVNPHPYFKPALDKNIKNLPKNIKAYLE